MTSFGLFLLTFLAVLGSAILGWLLRQYLLTEHIGRAGEERALASDSDGQPDEAGAADGLRSAKTAGATATALTGAVAAKHSGSSDGTATQALGADASADTSAPGGADGMSKPKAAAESHGAAPNASEPLALKDSADAGARQTAVETDTAVEEPGSDSAGLSRRSDAPEPSAKTDSSAEPQHLVDQARGPSREQEPAPVKPDAEAVSSSRGEDGRADTPKRDGQAGADASTPEVPARTGDARTEDASGSAGIAGARDSAASDGATSDGATSDGATSDGATSDGTSPAPSSRNGASTSPKHSKPSGTARTDADRTPSDDAPGIGKAASKSADADRSNSTEPDRGTAEARDSDDTGLRSGGDASSRSAASDGDTTTAPGSSGGGDAPDAPPTSDSAARGSKTGARRNVLADAGRELDSLIGGGGDDSGMSADEAEAMRLIDSGEFVADDSNRPAMLLAGASEGEQDDLKQIKGVGPKLEDLLNSLGIYYFRQIAAFSARDIAWIDSKLKFRGRIVRDRWVQQAKRLG